MVMQRIPVLLTIILFGAFLGSCTKGLEEMNINPNESVNTNPEFLLSNVLIATAYGYQKDAYWDKPASAGRYITMVRNEGNDKFSWSPQSWDDYYSRLSTNYVMMDIATKQGQLQYLPIGKILEAFNFAYLTDLYGDVPYTDALKLKENRNPYPKYDQQKDIYPALLKTLKDANDQLATTTVAIPKAYDPMYGGVYMKWRKLANSLRLRMLLRISKNYPSAFTEMQEIVNNPSKYPIFEGNEDNAEVAYIDGTKDNFWPGSNEANDFSEFDKRKPSKEIVDALLQRNDPRLQVWIAPRDNPAGGTVDKNLYVGVPNAVPAPYDYNGGAAFVSRLSAMFNTKVHPMVKASLITYAEVCFTLAEVAQAGKVNVPGKTAEALYYAGIRANMKYYGVEQKADDDKYFDQPAVKYNGTLEQLIVQKWISNFLKGAEGWFDHRRTGFPKFVLGPSAAYKSIPTRYLYPSGEWNLNRDQYQKALTVFGEDKLFTLMWYLK
ncbi:Starch-binding associating with outer membrane [Chitinophaga terrae (ex Kim and Jung 2007)]|uniref:Starch-binding associating with outer membrane n=2 Tax=Chitinophaga terrae (ex Kim and Jung 2007) TaxID=408074 RepID=A0A1H4ARX7_9BACT|nr:hypothetical protein CTE07_08160 [Chitinophaga terrae (ex Kim and Jung 2007)]SEA38673.1 Starch-binding associating with outer membrane [Chitinophaga terrae (ex Kim and Jung 2007)]